MTTSEEKDLILAYWPMLNVEFERIGLTDQDPVSLGMNRPFTKEIFEAMLVDLRAVPSGVGLAGYLARQGIDLDDVMRELSEPPPNEEL